LLEMIDKAAAEIGDGPPPRAAAPPEGERGRHRRWAPFSHGHHRD